LNFECVYLGFLFLPTPLQPVIQKFPECFIQFAHVSTQILDPYVEPSGQLSEQDLNDILISLTFYHELVEY